MQHLYLGAAKLRLLHDFMQSDHEYQISVEALTMEQRLVNTLDLLDGQVNVNANTAGPHRTATLKLSDPDRSLDFGTSLSTDDYGVLWVNRIIQVRHIVQVPGIGEVISTPFVGVPGAVSRDGGELSMELADKTVLADHGTAQRTFSKGWNAAAVVRAILREMTGERYMRIPNHPKKMSQPYTVSMADENSTPWQIAKRVAGAELGWRLFYSADGFATAGPPSASRGVVPLNFLLGAPDTSESFDSFANYVRVTSTFTTQTQQYRDRTLTGTAALRPSDPRSASSLSRNGVPRLLPLVLDDSEIKSRGQIKRRAEAQLKTASGSEYELAYEVMPFFHLDEGDYFDLPREIGGRMVFNEGSIPLGVGGSMTVGRRVWVSRPVISKSSKRTFINEAGRKFQLQNRRKRRRKMRRNRRG